MTKSVFETRSIDHACYKTPRVHIFCSFLAPLLQSKPRLRMDVAVIDAGRDRRNRCPGPRAEPVTGLVAARLRHG